MKTGPTLEFTISKEYVPSFTEAINIWNFDVLWSVLLLFAAARFFLFARKLHAVAQEQEKSGWGWTARGFQLVGLSIMFVGIISTIFTPFGLEFSAAATAGFILLGATGTLLLWVILTFVPILFACLSLVWINSTTMVKNYSRK